MLLFLAIPYALFVLIKLPYTINQLKKVPQLDEREIQAKPINK